MTGRDFPPIEDVLQRALGGEPVRDLRIRMFFPALGRDASIRLDVEPLLAHEGAVRGLVAAITEVKQDPVVA